jgi:hypothetical protein
MTINLKIFGNFNLEKGNIRPNIIFWEKIRHRKITGGEYWDQLLRVATKFLNKANKHWICTICI